MRTFHSLAFVMLLLATACRVDRTHTDVQRAMPAAESIEVPDVAAQTGPAIAVETIVLDASPQSALEFLPTGASWAEAAPDFGTDELLRRVALQTDTDVVSHPKILTRDGARANITTSDEFEYVKDYTVDTRAVPQKVVGHMTEGLWLSVTPKLSDDQHSANLKLDITSKSVRRPIPERVVHVGGLSANVRIQAPELDTQQVSLDLNLALGRAIFVRIGDHTDAERGARVRLAFVRIDTPH